MKRLPILFILPFSMALSAQEFSFSGNFTSFSQYYVDDKKTGDFTEKDRFRSNNYLKLNSEIDKFSFGLQIEGYAPQAILNYSPSFDEQIGVATYFANYKNEKLDITAGYFYEQFGNGLIFRSWEDQQLGLNNALRGGKIKYAPFQYLQFIGLYGKHRVGFDVSEGEVYGFDTEFNISEALKIEKSTLNFGFSIVNRSQEIENAAEGFNKNTFAYSGRLNYSKNNFYSNVEYVIKDKDALLEFGSVNTNSLSKGNALLYNAGYSYRRFGLNATFRRLENMTYYSDREVNDNIDNEQLVNYLPSLTKQHDYSLANIYVYQTQSRVTFNPFEKAGEIGYQLDAYYQFEKETFLGGKYGTNLAINYASLYGLDAEFNRENRTFDAEFLSLGRKYFTDFNVEMRKKWSKQWTSIFTYINLFYNKKYLEERSGKVNAQIAIIDATYQFLPTKSVRFEAQHLWTNDDRENWLAGTAEFNFSSKFSLFANDSYNYGNEINKIHYFTFGGSYTKNSTRFSLNYGRQRGGLICIGGVCRVVPESTGFGLNLSTSF
ncbi:MAG: hypothetical protein CVU08_04870 [Bacteroidetes bacterium HGW-Bacteroidetes-3]|nr:MAG: hypothetical protein CVU08_04870 [Bacteroidetes bacterium HGW-Bacteroidetes-3]